MAARFLYNLVNLAYLALQRPSELPIAIERASSLRGPLIGIVTLTALAQGVGAYLMRDYYDSNFALVILVFAAIVAAVTVLWAILFASVIDAFVLRLKHERAGRIWSMAAILMCSALPNAFIIAVAIIARFLAQPLILTIPMYLGVFVWSLFITLRGLQYLYELNTRAAIRLYFQSLAITLGFPAAVVAFVSLRLAQSFL
ncbi:MAG: hypothetical protein K1X75_04610 [Leptospirales bacterium]|nr:hypothetical protein [Leptospirales bacterium]